MSGCRPWLALVVALFCVPLFVGLGQDDVRDDEAIYSFAVDRILETGDWLEPKSIPNEDWAFLEKPPLKFWIVAAPIRWGLLPHDEFGLRFWDALFGAAAFVYVYLIGFRLAGPICGGVAALVLFAHGPLLFAHGLRSNNMEAPLLLAYCGGVYHFLEWAGRPPAGLDPARPPNGARRAHALAVGLYFVLGFMTKFVAALFLPLVLAVVAASTAAYRERLLAQWRLWLGVTALVLALVAPWFIWATLQYGSFLWEMMVGAHVYTRFTGYLDPNHLEPWHFYWSTMYRRFAEAGAAYLVIAGLALLAARTLRRRWPEGFVVLTWAILPIVLISAGTSKLYHYVYPFLPPVALSVGYLASLAVLVGPVPFGGAMTAWNRLVATRFPRGSEWLREPVIRWTLLATASVAVGIATYTLVFGPVRLTWDSREVFRSSGVFRPAAVAFVFGSLAGAARGSSRALVAILVASMLPLPAYRQSLAALTEGEHPMRSARDCLLAVQAASSELPRGLYVDVPPPSISHPLYYYMRQVRPWIVAPEPSPTRLQTYLFASTEQRPTLIWEPTYQEFWHRSEPAASAGRGPSPGMVVFEDTLNDVFLLLPGPYGRCGAEARIFPSPD
jgi:4-amino-4-deoxy-L-arabinose transferase-like glycosyltransferase